jgi:hypothetical protein
MTNEDRRYWLRRAFKKLADGEKLKDVLRFLRNQVPQIRELEYADSQQVISTIDDIVEHCPPGLHEEQLAVEQFLNGIVPAF